MSAVIDFNISIASDMIIVVSVLSNDKYICIGCILLTDNYENKSKSYE